MEDRYSGFGLAKYLGANIDLSDVYFKLFVISERQPISKNKSFSL
jgi:hypothetical protein